jgi:glycosyltransferase 2 family protein
MKISVCLGGILSILFIYLAFRGIDYGALKNSLLSINYLISLCVVLIVTTQTYVRAMRWRLILGPIVKPKDSGLFRITFLGDFALAALPARLGELARPLILKKEQDVAASSVMATVVVERVFDTLSLAIMGLAALLNTSLPPFIYQTGAIALSVSIAALLFLIAFSIRKDVSLTTFERSIKRLPDKARLLALDIAHYFLDGLHILLYPAKSAVVGLASVLAWALNATAAYVLFVAFSFELNYFAALATMVVIALGSILPAAPGFIGTYHYACVLALTYFGIDKTTALSYAIVLHFLNLAPTVIIGGYFTWKQNSSMSNLLQRPDKE